MPDASQLEQHTQSFTVDLPEFTGTLGELIHALRSERLTPAQVDLFKLVKGYLAYYQGLTERLELATEMLPLLARVIELKTRLLLPRPPKEDEEVEEMVEAVLLLEEFEDAISFLRQRRSERRLILPAKAPKPSYTRRERPLKVKLERLGDIAARYRQTSYFELSKPRLTMAEAMGRLRDAVRRVVSGRFNDLVSEDWPTRVVFFAGMLELVKEGAVHAEQEEAYGPIELAERAEAQKVA